MDMNGKLTKTGWGALIGILAVIFGVILIFGNISWGILVGVLALLVGAIPIIGGLITIWEYYIERLHPRVFRLLNHRSNQAIPNDSVGGHASDSSQPHLATDPPSKVEPHLSHLRPSETTKSTVTEVCSSCQGDAEILNETPVRNKGGINTHTMYKCRGCGKRWSEEA